MLFSFITGATAFLTGFLWTRLDLSWLILPVLAVGIYLGLILAAFLFLMILCALVDPNKPQEHDNTFYRKAMGLYIEALITIVKARIHTEGLEKLPAEGRFLLVCNHQALADPGILLHVFRNRQLAFVAKKEAKDMFVVGKMMHRTMSQLIDRENDRSALKTILKCIQLIKDDEVSIGVFPEGGIKEIGKLAHFRNGVFKIAQKANVPIVICTLKNTDDILRNAAKRKPTDVELHLVDVIPPEAFAGRTTVDIAEQVYETMVADLGESFRPVKEDI